MVTTEIKLSFSDPTAETIVIKQGEVGREIVFNTDVILSGTYSYQLIIVKPDNTFTITTGTAAEGLITFTIPTQAGAVTGQGYYIVKIYDGDDLVVYSASGAVWVDDHLLLDSMIESIAEVNGYRFPEDFATQGELVVLANQIKAEIIDDTETADDSTWSSAHINNVIWENFSTSEEKFIGWWINGNPIYERVYTGLSINTNGSSWVHISSIDASTWDTVIDCKIFRTVNDKYSAMPIAEYTCNLSGIHDVAVSIVDSGFNDTITMAIVRYAKTV